jgi:hypothetical protein
VANVYLVCEGKPDGIDQRVLDLLVVQHHGLSAEIRAVGGDSGLGAVRGFLDRPPHDVAVSVQDRNYEPLHRAENTWLNPGRKFVWRRHEIENYLLEPMVVLELFRDFRRTVPAPWVSRLPDTETETAEMLQRLAVPLLVTHAAEILKAELIQAINRTGELKYAPKPPSSRSESDWLAALQADATRLVTACHNVAALPDFSPPTVAARFATLLGDFRKPTFLTSGDYLRDLDGHGLLSALNEHLHGLGATLSDDDLADVLARAAERIYRPDAIYQPDDFRQLAAILAQHCP